LTPRPPRGQYRPRRRRRAFRFPSLPPGNYKHDRDLQGFQSRTSTRCTSYLGQIKKVDFSLPLSGVTETVQVTAEPR
jgi:hypothetical protein